MSMIEININIGIFWKQISFLIAKKGKKNNTQSRENHNVKNISVTNIIIT